MPSYRGKVHGPDRAKAIGAVVFVHLGLAAVILSGLNVNTVVRSVDRLKTLPIVEELLPPVEEEPPPSPAESAPEDDPAPANLASKPSPVVVPKPAVQLPLEKIAAAEVPGPPGPDRTVGAAAVPGSGTGAGGEGSGFGGGGSGGTGSGRGFTPAQRVSKIPDSAYRQIVAMSGSRRGRIGLTLKVNTDGRPSNCRIARSSGNPSVDGLMCALAVDHVRFRPARDPEGRPVAQDITWFPDWSPR